MSNKRIVPCLDLKDGRVVKGVQFVDLRDAGDPVELAAFYEQEGASELVLLDISASDEGRVATLDVVRKVARQLTIPFTVGGGIRSLAQMKAVIEAGADKISMSSAAITNPALIQEGAEHFGSRRIVLAIDARYDEKLATWRVYSHGGKKATDLTVMTWAQRAVELGAGEILLTSMDRDGEKAGYDLAMIEALCQTVNIPIIASGGAGRSEHFHELFTQTNANAALAASIFHYKETSVKEVKADLQKRGVTVS